MIVVVVAGDALLGAGDSRLGTLAPGEVRFIKREIRPVIMNKAATSTTIIFVILKRHWGAEVHVCAEPMKCSHPIRAGPAEIGQTRTLFSNGFITAYQHNLDRGGTLSNSYYSSHGRDHLLSIPLTAREANFDGVEEQLKAAQAYSSDATQIEVNANSREARWVVIRVLIPRNSG